MGMHAICFTMARIHKSEGKGRVPRIAGMPSLWSLWLASIKEEFFT